MDNNATNEHLRSSEEQAKREKFEEELEAIYWEFDGLRSGTVRRDTHGVLGPMAERDAFKRAVRRFVAEELKFWATTDT